MQTVAAKDNEAVEASSLRKPLAIALCIGFAALGLICLDLWTGMTPLGLRRTAANPWALAARAADLLVSTTHDILGTILTKVPQNAGTYGGYYTYQRYGRYFDESQATAEKMEDTSAKGELTQGKK